MNEGLEEKLDTSGQFNFRRKVNIQQTVETPIYNQFMDLWEESDDQFRSRILEALKNVKPLD